MYYTHVQIYVSMMILTETPNPVGPKLFKGYFFLFFGAPNRSNSVGVCVERNGLYNNGLVWEGRLVGYF